MTERRMDENWMRDLDTQVSDDDIRQLLSDEGIPLEGAQYVACQAIMRRWNVSYNVAYDMLRGAVVDR